MLRMALSPEQNFFLPSRPRAPTTGRGLTVTVTEFVEETEQPVLFEITRLYVPVLLAMNRFESAPIAPLFSLHW